MLSALHRADGYCVDDQPRLEARLDREKASDVSQHCQ
jgi:hypothetical protein